MELDREVGLNDGTVGGHVYFNARAGHGVLTVPAKCALLLADRRRGTKRVLSRSPSPLHIADDIDSNDRDDGDSATAPLLPNSRKRPLKRATERQQENEEGGQPRNGRKRVKPNDGLDEEGGAAAPPTKRGDEGAASTSASAGNAHPPATVLQKTIVIRNVAPKLDRRFLSPIFEIFGAILDLSICVSRPGPAVPSPLADSTDDGNVDGDGDGDGFATVTIVYGDAKAARYAFESLTSEMLCKLKVGRCNKKIEIYLASEKHNRKYSSSSTAITATVATEEGLVNHAASMSAADIQVDSLLSSCPPSAPSSSSASSSRPKGPPSTPPGSGSLSLDELAKEAAHGSLTSNISSSNQHSLTSDARSARSKKELSNAPNGSWICQECGNLNFPCRTICNTKVCSKPRVGVRPHLPPPPPPPASVSESTTLKLTCSLKAADPKTLVSMAWRTDKVGEIARNLLPHSSTRRQVRRGLLPIPCSSSGLSAQPPRPACPQPAATRVPTPPPAAPPLPAIMTHAINLMAEAAGGVGGSVGGGMLRELDQHGQAPPSMAGGVGGGMVRGQRQYGEGPTVQQLQQRIAAQEAEFRYEYSQIQQHRDQCHGSYTNAVRECELLQKKLHHAVNAWRKFVSFCSFFVFLLFDKSRAMLLGPE